MRAVLFYILLFKSPALANQLILGVGQTHQLKVSANKDIRAGSSDLLRIIDNGNVLALIGKKAGSTYLQTGSRTWTLHILEANDVKLNDSIEAFFKNTRGLKKNIIEGRIHIQGELLALDDWLELTDLALKTKGQYVFEAKLDSQQQKEILEIWKKRFQLKIQADDIAWTPKPSLDQVKDSELATALLGFGLASNILKSDLKIERVVKVKVLISEVSRSLNKDMGIDWPSSAKVQLSPKLQGSDSLEAVIKLAASNGDAKILASPTLIARSGGEAEFLAGGEFPIRNVSRYGSSIDWKRHGIYLKFKPLADTRGRMKLEIVTEISMLDEGMAVDNIPAMKTNRISSQFDLKSSQTIIMSGLIKNIRGNSESGVPGLYQVPILGQLFGSKKFREEKSELVIFVTPEIESFGN